MPEKLEIQITDGVLRASVSGIFDSANARQFFLEILKPADAGETERILIDARGLTSEISTMARLDFAHQMAEQRAHGFEIALIGSETAVWPDHFLENVASNRGVNARVFTMEEEALLWLSE